MLSNFAPVIELSFTRSERFLFLVSSVFTLSQPSSSYYFFFLVDNLIKRESVHRDFFRINCTILRAPTIRPRITSRATEMTMTVVESRY